jgi:hypothetical protein
MQILSKYISLFAISVLLCVNIANAKTPDGETPSVETICDMFSENRGPAFGLCNAYCEAMDCGDPNQAASDRACIRINANFQRHTGLTLPTEVKFDSNGQVINNCALDPGPR